MEIRLCNNLYAGSDASATSAPGTRAEYRQAKILLGRQFVEILDCDPSVDSYQPYPVGITYKDSTDLEHVYVPDGLISFKKSIYGILLQPILCDVHFQSHIRLRHHRSEFLAMARAAKSFASRRGWTYQVFTEHEIRVPYLWNIQFLNRFASRSVEDGTCSRVIEILGVLGTADLPLLLHALCASKEMRLSYIPVVWHLVATGQIECDLDQPLTMQSVLRVAGDCYGS